MSVVVAGGFDDQSVRNVNDWIRHLIAIVSIGSSGEYLQELEKLLRTPVQPGPQTPAPKKLGTPIEQASQPAANSYVTDAKIDRIEALLESMAGGKRSFTTEQIAKLERVKPATVREWIRDGKLRAVADPYRMAGPHARRLILAEDYEEFKRGGH